MHNIAVLASTCMWGELFVGTKSLVDALMAAEERKPPCSLQCGALRSWLLEGVDNSLEAKRNVLVPFSPHSPLLTFGFCISSHKKGGGKQVVTEDGCR